MVRKGARYSLRLVLEIIRILDGLEKPPSTQELARLIGRDYSVTLRYRDILEEAGIVEVVPEGNKNLVILTPLGRCIARCLKDHT